MAEEYFLPENMCGREPDQRWWRRFQRRLLAAGKV